MAIQKTLFDKETVSGLAARAAVEEAFDAFSEHKDIYKLSSLGIAAFKEIADLIHQEETYEDSDEFIQKILKQAETAIDTMIRKKFFPDTLPKDGD